MSNKLECFIAKNPSPEVLQKRLLDISRVVNSLIDDAGGTNFSSITSGTNTAAVMEVSSGASLKATGSGIIDATEINGIPINGSLTHEGMIPISQPGNTSAVWADPLVQGIQNDGTAVSTIKPVLVSGKGADGNQHAISVSSTGVVDVEISALPLPTGGSTAANQTTEIASLASIDGKLTSPVAVTGPLTDTQLRATAVPVSATTLPLPTGASTETTLAAAKVDLDTLAGTVSASKIAISAAALPLPTGAATESTLSSAKTDLDGIKTDTDLLATTVSASKVNVAVSSLPLPTGAATETTLALAKTDLDTLVGGVSSSVYQENLKQVGGTATDTNSGNKSAGTLRVVIATDQPSLTNAQPVSAASLPLPTGAATSANQTTGNTSLSSIDAKLTSPLTVTGPLTAAQLANAEPIGISASALPLPTGASTAANQSTEITSLSSINGKLANDASGDLRVNGTGPAGSFQFLTASATGSFPNVAVPASTKYKVLTVTIEVTTDANVANRTVGLMIRNAGASQIYAFILSPIIMTASSGTCRFLFGGSIPLATAFTSQNATVPMPNFSLSATLIIEARLINQQVGDVLRLYVGAEVYPD